MGIGFSAGGLDAFKDFLRGIDPESQVSYVVIQHLAAGSRSQLLEITESNTTLNVEHIEDNHSIKAATIYVLKKDSQVRIENNHFVLSASTKKAATRSGIDSFFASLAEAKGDCGVGVILSGSGTDGTVGLQKIKTSGGMCLVQTPADAGFSGMPTSAIESGCVDYVGKAADLARKADAYFNHCLSVESGSDQKDTEQEKELLRILALVRRHAGNDFSDYRRNSIVRRIKRRMHLSGVYEFGEYLDILEKSESEVEALARDILISVTCFFRNPAVWRTLEKGVFPEMIQKKKEGETVRVWVPGCATGEEVYSCAILLNEAIERSGKHLTLQIYGTDIDENSRRIARAATYPAGIVDDVGEYYLSKYFEPTSDDRFEIVSSLREKVIFARQNVISDPPFSRMDLVSCRNFLIYLEPSMQKRVIALLHFALREEGIILLGSSENIGKIEGRFKPVHPEHRIFQRIGNKSMQASNGGVSIPTDQPSESGLDSPRRRSVGRNMEETSRALIMDHFGAVSAIVDRQMTVRYLGGKTERYLRQPEGAPTHDLTSMVNASVGLKLRQLGKLALTNKATQSFETSLTGSEVARTRVTIKPIRLEHSDEGLFVLFETITPDSADRDDDDADSTAHGETGAYAEPGLLNGLDQDLKAARDELAETVAELEISNEELKTSNEEIMSMNEELQSSNEELETSKEELQSLNEELNTVNSQLTVKVDELERSHNDVHNLLASTNIATIFLDDKLRIQRFTSATSRLFNLIDSDIGRPISDLAGKFDGDNLIATCRLVLDDLKSREETINDLDHAHYLRRILPYRTQDNRIEGVVITFDDITELRKTQENLIQAEQYLRLAIQNSPVSIFAQDLDLRYNYILNQPPEYSRDEILGKTDRVIFPENYEELKAFKEDALTSGKPSRRTIKITTLEQKTLWLDIMLECLKDSDGRITGLCGASVDVTEQVNREAELERAKEGAEAASRAKLRFLSGMSHDIRTPLTSIMSLSEILDELVDEELSEIGSEIQHACNHLLKTIDSVLDLARLQDGDFELSLEPIDLGEVLEETCCVFDPSRKRINGRERISLTMDEVPLHVHAEKGAVLRIIGNLVGNALKFCPEDVIEITAAKESGYARIEVVDRGPGISREFQKELFKPFTQERGKQKTSLPGSGLGLSISSELVSLLRGTINVESGQGKGTTMVVRLPLSRGDPKPAVAGGLPSPLNGPLGDALICDDHNAIRRMLRRMLANQPVTVVETEEELYANLDGKQALLLDINLHGKNRGVEIMRDLRANPKYQPLRIVAFTAHSQPGQREQFLKEGFDDYLSKPFKKKDLLAKLFVER